MQSQNNETYSNEFDSNNKTRNYINDCSVDNCSVESNTATQEEIPAPKRSSETDVFPERERRDGPGGE